jgi:hypothetical protein
MWSWWKADGLKWVSVFLYPERPENSRRKVAAEAFRTVS